MPKFALISTSRLFTRTVRTAFCLKKACPRGGGFPEHRGISSLESHCTLGYDLAQLLPGVWC